MSEELPTLHENSVARESGQLMREMDGMAIILLTTSATDQGILEALTVGAKGYMLKDIATVGLVSAIQAVYNGEQVTTPVSAVRVLPDKQQTQKRQAVDRRDELTAREKEVLILVARGMVAKEIARSLTISEKTVRNHLSNIYQKLDIYDRSHIVIYALKHGLVDINDI